jgi:truncated hemoglobin YjbI
MTQEEWISKVVSSFYEKARNDILIGYHFRNISDFNEHIPRIVIFWEIQLLGRASSKTGPFDVMNKHVPLGIKKGELGRWILLFKKTIEEEANHFPEMSELKTEWEKKIEAFKEIFLRFFRF